ncbi:MAG: glycosyltransferase [Gemmataceae bacterium]|nr:glycosyltransferase [Gemmataceae bacterium]
MNQANENGGSLRQTARLCKRWLRRHFARRLHIHDLLHWPAAERPWPWQQGNHLASWLARFGLSPPFPLPDPAGFSAAVALYEYLPEVRSVFPLGLTPFGLRPFTGWLLTDGLTSHGMSLEKVLGFLQGTPEKSGQLWAISYLNQPEWQEKFPRALRFEEEWRKLLAWLRRKYPLRGNARWLPAFPCGLLGETGRVQVAGHFQYPSGLQVAADALVESLQAAGCPVSRRGVPAAATDQPRDFSCRALLETGQTIVVMSPQPYFASWASRAGVFLPPPHRVYGVWYWEMEETPDEWADLTEGVEELWAPTTFIQKALEKTLTGKVAAMLPAVTLPSFQPLTRAELGLPMEDFLFLFVFDLASVMERKNPLGLIRAFDMAFENAPGTGLVIKVSRGEQHPREMNLLLQAAKGKRVALLEGNYSREKVLALMQACDAYVSLHRSEGFGLTLAEAMLLGKPVLATDYSGNTDFLDASCSLPVNFTRVELAQDFGPYKKGWHWAEPDLADAAEKMRRLASDRQLALRLGELGRQRALKLFSNKAAGQRMLARLNRW